MRNTMGKSHWEQMFVRITVKATKKIVTKQFVELNSKILREQKMPLGALVKRQTGNGLLLDELQLISIRGIAFEVLISYLRVALVRLGNAEYISDTLPHQ